jgi:hypothetical protein
MADIFISYSKDYRQLTVDLARDLEASGFSVWWDTSLVAGEAYAPTITRELAESRAVIVIWTPASVASAWVYSEATRAYNAKKLIQVAVPGLDHALLPPPFDVLHCVSLDDRAAILAAISHRGMTKGTDPTAQTAFVPSRPKSMMVRRSAIG